MSRIYPHLPKTKRAVLQTLTKEFNEDKAGEWVLAQLINGTYFFYPKVAPESWTKHIEHAEKWSAENELGAHKFMSLMSATTREGDYKIMKFVRHNNQLALLV